MKQRHALRYTHTHAHTGSINNSGYKLIISISRFLSSSQIPRLSITWNIFYWPPMSHTHGGRTYRLSRPWTGAVDGVLADNTIWFVRRQPGHDHATRRGGDCLDASRWTRNYGEHTGTSAKRACVCACVHAHAGCWMPIKASRLVCRLLVLSCAKPLWEDLEEPLGGRW